MSHDEIIHMAREAGAYAPKYPIGPHDVQFSMASIERFANLVAAAEREGCARLCELRADEEIGMAYQGIALDCAAAIRARSQS